MFKVISSLVVLLVLAFTLNAAKADFAIPSVEASIDRGLFVEFVLKCEEVLSGDKTSSIMSYSKTEAKYCSSQDQCFDTARQAAIQSCNVEKVVSNKNLGAPTSDENSFKSGNKISR